MQHTQLLQATQPQAASRISWSWLAPACFGLTLLILYVVVALNPGLLLSTKRLLSTGNDWMLPSAVAGVAMLGFSAAWWVLMRFSLRVQREPFAWTAPLFVVVCFAGLGVLNIQAPLRGISTPHFLIACAPLILAGGVIANRGDWLSLLVGSLMCLTPAIGFVGAMSQQASWIHTSGPDTTFLLVASLLFVGLVVVGLAIVTRANGQPSMPPIDATVHSALVKLHQQMEHMQRERLAAQQAYAQVVAIGDELRHAQSHLASQWAALEASRVSSTAAVADVVPRRRSPEDDTAAFVALTKGGGIRPLTKAAIAVCGFAVLGASAYWGLYVPQQERQRAVIAAAKARAAADAKAIMAIKREAAEARATTEAALAAEREKTWLAEREAAAAKEAIEQAKQSEEAQAVVAPTPAKTAKARRKRSAQHDRSGAKRTVQPPKQDSSNDPLAGLEEGT